MKKKEEEGAEGEEGAEEEGEEQNDVCVSVSNVPQHTAYGT